MAGDWIKVEMSTPDKPEIACIAGDLGLDIDAAFGKAFRVWVWFDQHTTDGHAPSVTKTTIDRVAGVSGFCDAMQRAGWMKEADGFLHMPNFQRHNGKSAKNRVLALERKRQQRASGHDDGTGMSRTERDAGVTREERREKREESKRTSEHVAGVSTPKGKKQGTDEDVRYAKRMFEYIQKVVPSAKPPNYTTWANDIRLMRERDGRTHTDIADLFRWANAHPFWGTNILSPSKLREKWTQLEAQRLRENGHGANQQSSVESNDERTRRESREYLEREGLT